MKNIKLSIAILGCLMLLTTNYIQCQGVSISIIDKSFRIKNDSLFFKVRLENNTVNPLFFWNLEMALYDATVWKMNGKNLQYYFPTLSVNILNDKNKPLNLSFAMIPGSRYLSPQKKVGLYYLVKPHTFIVYEVGYDIWIVGLKKGKYSIQLKYYGNEFSRKDFEKIKLKNNKLTNYVLHKGMLKSKTYWIYVPTSVKKEDLGN